MNKSFWFITGSQHLYGEEILRQVANHSQAIVEGFNNAEQITYPIIFKPTVKTPEEIRQVLMEANMDDSCAGVITWMHTFSPAKMWIAGLSILNKPLLHLHTQFNQDIPWDEIDMDFMNLNQSAHGDREYGFIGARMEIPRKVIAGYWEDIQVRERIGQWMHVANAYVASRNLKVARFGDNMRQVAVTEGDKVEAQIKFGWEVHGYGVGDLAAIVNQVTDAQVDELMKEYYELYTFPEDASEQFIASVREQARIEIGLEKFLVDGGFGAFTTTFEDLHGFKQLPGLAVQRLMEKGFGFGGEGDWKTSALTRMMKIMANNKGTSFMEDYTYHLNPSNPAILGAHMLEVCPTIASKKPTMDVKPLGIGGKEDPARLIFNSRTGLAVCASLVDLGHRFRLIISQVNAVDVPQNMPNLPVANVMWQPEPSLETAAEAWIYAGGAHHTVFSYNVTIEQLTDWAEMCGIECVVIDSETRIATFRNELRWNDIYWKLNK
ncbi:L-arabinose isomerase [Vallitalea okinawensis]|uniref:L-arabinose isomerase n=1 Tax=Vallitalea okinawensis TaxID=2078660 RepID=UPI000CFB8410|nr:L-arabinose isomerase [Vallitalea okinawensis]